MVIELPPARSFSYVGKKKNVLLSVSVRSKSDEHRSVDMRMEDDGGQMI